VAGIFGGIFTTFGLMLPSIIIIMALSYVIDLVRDNKWVEYLFKGIRAGVLVLIAKAVLSFFRNMRKDWFDFVLLAGAFLIAFLTEVSVIYIILGTIVICILALVIKNSVDKKKKQASVDAENEPTEKTPSDEIEVQDESNSTENTEQSEIDAINDVAEMTDNTSNETAENTLEEGGNE
jgi:predicted membrane protein